MTERPPAAVGHVANPGRQRDLGRENAVLRELVTVYRQLSGLALQDADLASVTQLIADRTAATVAVVSPVMDVIAAASPGVPAEKAAALIREAIVHPRLGQVLRASREGHRPLWLPSVGGMPAVIVAPVLVGDDVPAHLITMEAAGGPSGGHAAAGHRARRHHLRGDPGPGERGRRRGPAGARRPGRGPAAGPRPGRRGDQAVGRPSRVRRQPGAQRAGHRVRRAAAAARPGPGRAAAAGVRRHRALLHHPGPGCDRLGSRVRGGAGHRGGRPATAGRPERPAAGRYLPVPAGRAVPGHPGHHRHRRPMPQPGRDHPVLPGSTPHPGDAAPPRPGRHRHRVRRPGHPPAAAASPRPGRVALVRGRRARRADPGGPRPAGRLPDHAGLLPPGEQQPAARRAVPARAPEHGRLPGETDRGDHRPVPGLLPGPAQHPGSARDPGRTGIRGGGVWPGGGTS